ncbi:Heme-binding protein 2 [Rhynchospora pubera]|uniref:Heme-binding protein 2 n=1 Tax=Rhynchospora pubera TaxID=906938 RepID=A0AAV8DG46_9POAL|nr:Heme-binding protein 2 [Rhynchospora pubera]
MKRSTRLWFLLVSIAALLVPGRATESPQFTVVHTESEFEIRLYRSIAWMSAPSDKISFEKATKHGFHRLFQYIQGANLNSTRLRMTKPVVTSIVPGAGALHSSAYYVRLYLQTKFQASPPVPLPELDLVSDKWAPCCVAVRKFSGFARDSNMVKEAEKLALSLSKSSWANSTNFDSTNAYSIAQYDSPFKLFGRVNEIWVDVTGSEETGCGSSSGSLLINYLSLCTVYCKLHAIMPHKCCIVYKLLGLSILLMSSVVDYKCFELDALIDFSYIYATGPL